MEQPERPNRVLAAVRLGWLTVETFGRLRRYASSARKPPGRRGDARKRFDFSDRSLSERDALLLAADQLRHTAARLDFRPDELPLPSPEELDQSLDAGLDLDTLQGQLDDWSTHVWVVLSTEDEVAGRGFTYGGSLADTYWHTDVLGPDHFAELLRPQRLDYIASRFQSIADHLPPYTAQVLNHTLRKWRIQHRLEQLDPAARKQVMRRLESQAKVWHDLLFGGRSAESYLTGGDRRLITWGAAGSTALLVLGTMLLVWLAVLALSSAGRTVAASMTGLPRQLSEAQAAFIGDVLDWQKWSSLLATLSSVVVLITGFIHRLSGWVLGFHRLVREWLQRQLIYRRTYRHWGLRPE